MAGVMTKDSLPELYVYKVYDTKTGTYANKSYNTQGAAVGQAGTCGYNKEGRWRCETYRNQDRYQVHKFKLENPEVIA